MPSSIPYQLLADLVLLLHFATVIFVIGGLLAILIGNPKGWRWVNGLWFRLAHLAAIVVIVLQAWLGRLCPLTILELWLREQAGQATYTVSFVEHWVQQLLYFEAPMWVFALAYTLFGLLVLAAWWRYPPRPGHR
jgi:hypothetical protein